MKKEDVQKLYDNTKVELWSIRILAILSIVYLLIFPFSIFQNFRIEIDLGSIFAFIFIVFAIFRISTLKDRLENLELKHSFLIKKSNIKEAKPKKEIKLTPQQIKRNRIIAGIVLILMVLIWVAYTFLK
jgi:hypothetical protein